MYIKLICEVTDQIREKTPHETMSPAWCWWTRHTCSLAKEQTFYLKRTDIKKLWWTSNKHSEEKDDNVDVVDIVIPETCKIVNR